MLVAAGNGPVILIVMSLAALLMISTFQSGCLTAPFMLHRVSKSSLLAALRWKPT